MLFAEKEVVLYNKERDRMLRITIMFSEDETISSFISFFFVDHSVNTIELITDVESDVLLISR